MNYLINARRMGACSLFILGLIAFSGCDSLRQEVNPDRLNREAAKLVVTCFLSPQDTVLAVKVTRSQPVLGVSTSFSYQGVDVTNATVTLAEGSRTATLHYDGKLGYYRAPVSLLPIVAGRTYSISVQTPAGEQATASTFIPELVPLTDILLDSAITNEYGRATKQYYVRLRWRDPAGKPNFYQIMGDNEHTYTNQYRPSPSAPVRDTTVTSRGKWFFNNSSTTTDIGRDGQELVSARGRLSTVYSFTNGKQDLSRPVGKLNAYLLNVDEAYFRYYDAVERQNQLGDNPFAEPVPVPTNILGGLGCFAGYNRSSLTIELK